MARVVRFAPPLVITHAQIDEAVAALRSRAGARSATRARQHRAGAGLTPPRCVDQTRSTISAMPWPTPMHIVHSA